MHLINLIHRVASHDLVVDSAYHATDSASYSLYRCGGIRAMATNPPKGDGKRNGAVRGRSQLKHPDGRWIKRNTETGRFIDRKSDEKPFKGVRREK